VEAYGGRGFEGFREDSPERGVRLHLSWCVDCGCVREEDMGREAQRENGGQQKKSVNLDSARRFMVAFCLAGMSVRVRSDAYLH
jgi:hypothetical protein